MLDHNTATVQQLDARFGVGLVSVVVIVAWRQANGKFICVCLQARRC